MKVMIATLGRNEQGRIAFVMNRRGADALVIMCTRETHNDAERIRDEILEKGHMPIEIVQVEPWRFDDVLFKAVKTVNTYMLEQEGQDNDEEVEFAFNPSLGTRIMSAALYAAAAFTKSVIHLVKEDGKGHAIDVVDVFPITREQLSPPKKRVLESLSSLKDERGNYEWCPSIGRLAKTVRLGMSATSDHVSTLHDWGYVETEKVGNTKKVRITKLGNAVLEMTRIWKAQEHGEDK